MPLRSSRVLRERAAAGVVVCLTHGPLCKKYPDHPAVQERKRREIELSKDLAEMVQAGHLLIRLKELADAGYEVPEEFTRGNEDPPRSDRVRLFFERYDLGKHFRSDEPNVEPPCKTRKLSDDELRQRKEWAAEVKEARQRKNLPDPTPPWEKRFDSKLSEMIQLGRAAQPRELTYDPEVAKMLGQGPYAGSPEHREFEAQLEAHRATEKAEKAALAKRLKADEELARKMSEALATWMNLPPRNSRHTQDVREGYGDAVPEFEEE